MSKRASSPSSLKEETTAAVKRTLTSLSPSLSFDSAPQQQLPTLPLDLVIEILYRLPVKSLLQLRCVCKSWNSLISADAKFGKKQLYYSITKNRYRLIITSTYSSGELLFCDSSFPSVTSPPDCTTSTSVALKYPPIPNYAFSLGFGVSSCDGIICYSISKSSALLCNPSTRKLKLLPHLEIPLLRVYATLYSFGYHHFTKTYKIVALSLCTDLTNYVSVHTLGTDFWRKIKNFPYNGFTRSQGIFVSDTVNWLTRHITSREIISLDLNKECYHKLLQPDYGMVNEQILSLGVSRDCLCILALCDAFVGVWLMKEYGNEDSWTKLFSVSFMEHIGPFVYTKAVYISEDDQVLLLEVLKRSTGESNLVLYDSRNGTFKIPEIQNINGWMASQVCIESLISPFS